MSNTITAAERAARKGQPPQNTVAWHKKNPDGTRCGHCKPIVVTTRSTEEGKMKPPPTPPAV